MCVCRVCDNFTSGPACAEAYERLGEREKALPGYKAVLKNAPRHEGAIQGSASLNQQGN